VDAEPRNPEHRQYTRQVPYQVRPGRSLARFVNDVAQRINEGTSKAGTIMNTPTSHHRRLFLLAALFTPAGLPRLRAFAHGRLLQQTEESPETENNWEGPFYKPGAPVRSVLLEKGMAGTPLTVTGRVLDTGGRPLKGALLDIWQADHTGTYDNAGFRLRGRLYTGDDGRYTLRTIKPLYYGAPGDMRPAHIHVKASLEQSPVLTTQLYFKGDPWLQHDPGVRPTLIMATQQVSDGLAARFDFVIRTR
jgi:protocatechuate 3,4-dioxygenase beta subunit